jgi:hypothetical protein
MSITLINQKQIPYQFPESAISKDKPRDESQDNHALLASDVLTNIANWLEPYELPGFSAVSVRVYKVMRNFQEKIFSFRKDSFSCEITQLNNFIISHICSDEAVLSIFATLDLNILKAIGEQTGEDIMTETDPQCSAAKTIRKDREEKLSGLLRTLTIDDFVYFITANPEESPMTFFRALSPVDQETIKGKIRSSSDNIDPKINDQSLEEQIRSDTTFLKNAINALKKERGLMYKVEI